MIHDEYDNDLFSIIPTGRRSAQVEKTSTLEKDALIKALLGWFRRHRRDLPWRREPSPYAVWVSEIMLQQTQVSRVLAYYRRWMERFGDLRSVARASEDEVLKLWEGWATTRGR